MFDVDLHLETGASRQRQQRIQRELVDLALQEVVEARLGDTEAARGLRLRDVWMAIITSERIFMVAACSGLSDSASHTFANILAFMISTHV